jgi:hypothetical protein
LQDLPDLKEDDSDESSSFSYIRELLDWFFQDNKANKILSEEKWTILYQYLARCLINPSRIDLKTLLWHTENCQGFFYASRFMSLLVQHILIASNHSQQKESHSRLVETLTSVVWPSGPGYCSEYIGHREILSAYEHHRHYQVRGLDQENPTGFTWEVPNLRLQRFHQLEDIERLPLGSYGIPDRATVRHVDAIVQPDMIISYRPVKSRAGDDQKVETLRGFLLEKDRGKHKFLWIVHENSEYFNSRIDGLGDIPQYVMSLAAGTGTDISF